MSCEGGGQLHVKLCWLLRGYVRPLVVVVAVVVVVVVVVFVVVVVVLCHVMAVGNFTSSCAGYCVATYVL